MDLFGEACIFSSLDACSGYSLTEIDDGYNDNTTFTSHHELQIFFKIPLCLKNAPSTFQLAMDIILSMVRWQLGLVHLDNVLIFIRDVEEYLDHTMPLLGLLLRTFMALNPNKCFFFEEHIDYWVASYRLAVLVYRQMPSIRFADKNFL